MTNSKKQTKNEKRRAARQKAKNTKNTKLFASIAAIAVLGFSGYWFFARKQNLEINTYIAQVSEKLGQDIVIDKEAKYSIQSRQHISTNQAHVPYSTNPPTSGPHSDASLGGFYANGLRDENAIHNLEHGFIWISYKNVSNEEIDKIERIAQKYRGRVIASQRNDNDEDGVVLAAWGKMLKLRQFDDLIAEDFIKRNFNKSPEQLAR